MEFPPHYTSKEAIRARLLQNAADFWGIRSTADVDPLVRLLVEALAGELYNLSNDLKNTEGRLLHKLAALLTPDLLTASLPAHALMQALPVEPVEQLSEYRHFVHSAKQTATGNTPQEVFFTPAVPVTLYDARITYLATGNRLYQYDAQRGKVLAAVAAPGQYLPPQTLWIGLRLREGIAHLDQLSFYFDWKNYTFGEDWYKLLTLCTCTINGIAQPLQAGFKYGAPTHTTQRDALEHTLSFDTMPVIIRDVLAFYDHHYLSFSGEPVVPAQQAQMPYPTGFTTVFPERDLAPLQDPLLWVQFSFPAAIGQHLLDNVEVYTNAFPVVNRRLHKLKHRFKGIGNIIPIKPDVHEFFLSVEYLTDSRGRNYRPVAYHQSEDQQQDAYSIRMGGAERFDNRNAREMIHYLFELLRDESAAFSAYGYDFLTDVLKNLQQNLALVEQKAQHALHTMTEATRYVIVKPQNPSETMHLEYWTTQSEAANQLRSGMPLLQFEGAGTRPESLVLLTKPAGGRKAADQSNLLQAYKYSLMTRDRIVTEDDIKSFCRHELGHRVTDIQVRRGVMVSPHPGEGLRKTTDIVLTPRGDAAYTEEEWAFTTRGLLQKLKTRSAALTVYRVVRG
ncbi:MAG TPA: type VI secretion system baseplate subunit TssF [Chitinophaga sp.]